MSSLIPKINVSSALEIPIGFHPLNEMMQGGFKRGELLVIMAKSSMYRPQPEGIRKLFSGEDGVVIGPEESHYLFGGKSNLTWNMILKDPVLLERFKNATHTFYDTEGTAMEDFQKRFKGVLDEPDKKP